MLSNILGGNKMEQKLKITDGNGTNFTIYGSEKELETFIKWVNDYKHGTCHESTVTCKTPSDMKACNFKAIRMKLSPSQYSVNNKNHA